MREPLDKKDLLETENADELDEDNFEPLTYGTWPNAYANSFHFGKRSGSLGPRRKCRITCCPAKVKCVRENIRSNYEPLM